MKSINACKASPNIDRISLVIEKDMPEFPTELRKTNFEQREAQKIRDVLVMHI